LNEKDTINRNNSSNHHIFGATAKQIIDKNIELTGGLTNWKLLNSIILQGKVILGVNDEYPIEFINKDLILPKQ
jgi:hypothetical protein